MCTVQPLFTFLFLSSHIHAIGSESIADSLGHGLSRVTTASLPVTSTCLCSRNFERLSLQPRSGSFASVTIICSGVLGCLICSNHPQFSKLKGTAPRSGQDVSARLRQVQYDIQTLERDMSRILISTARTGTGSNLQDWEVSSFLSSADKPISFFFCLPYPLANHIIYVTRQRKKIREQHCWQETRE